MDDLPVGIIICRKKDTKVIHENKFFKLLFRETLNVTLDDEIDVLFNTLEFKVINNGRSNASSTNYNKTVQNQSTFKKFATDGNLKINPSKPKSKLQVQK
jgi:hypothetical protein